MSAVWSTLETHVVNGTFPLQRCVGSTAHSGVFLTQSTPHAPSAVALKLIPFDQATEEAQLARWRAAIELSHPHLVRIFEAGECRVAGLHYLYARMEFADQTLAQVLAGRALTEDEVREMLVPTLGALEYLHRKGLAQAGLKPSNFLVVGDELKLASDTVRASGASDADAGAAADIHALGVTLCEALTRVRPSGLDGNGDVGLPAELPASFRAILMRCLSRAPRDRPTAGELQAWLRGAAPAAASPSPAPAPPVPSTAPAPATRLVIRIELPGEEPPQMSPGAQHGTWRPLPLVVGVVVLVALGWVGYRMFSTKAEVVVPEPPPRAAVVPVAPPATATVAVVAPPPVTPATPVKSTGTPVNEVLPTVSQSSLDTIRGTLRVSVRVILDEDGTVIAAAADDPGPSRYFERRAVEAAKQWTFAPAPAGQQQRTLLVGFAFTRTGVTASARPPP